MKRHGALSPATQANECGEIRIRNANLSAKAMDREFIIIDPAAHSFSADLQEFRNVVGCIESWDRWGIALRCCYSHMRLALESLAGPAWTLGSLAGLLAGMVIARILLSRLCRVDMLTGALLGEEADDNKKRAIGRRDRRFLRALVCFLWCRHLVPAPRPLCPCGREKQKLSPASWRSNVRSQFSLTFPSVRRGARLWRERFRLILG